MQAINYERAMAELFPVAIINVDFAFFDDGVSISAPLWDEDRFGPFVGGAVEAKAQELETGVARDSLLAYAEQRRWELETGGIEVNGQAIRTDEQSQLKITGAVVGAMIDAAGGDIDFQVQPGVWVTITPQEMQALGVAVKRHVQRCFSALRQIQAGISATPPTVSSPEEVDAAFEAALAP